MAQNAFVAPQVVGFYVYAAALHNADLMYHTARMVDQSVFVITLHTDAVGGAQGGKFIRRHAAEKLDGGAGCFFHGIPRFLWL